MPAQAAPNLTPVKRNQVRDLLLKKGFEAFRRSSISGAGLKEVLDSASVPKGSFYYYFESKDSFVHEILQTHADRHVEHMQAILSDLSLNPVQRIRKYFETEVDTCLKSYDTKRIFLAKAGLELVHTDDVARQIVEQSFKKLESGLAGCLAEAQLQRQISGDIDCEGLATLMLNSWQGALLRMKTQQSVAPLQTFIELFVEEILETNLLYSKTA